MLKTKREIKEHLDKCIRYWRKERDLSPENLEKGSCYVDAYQSIRTSIFDETLD